MVTWARDAFFFSFFLGLTAFGVSAVGAPSHPTMCELAPALVCLHTWIPMMQLGGILGLGDTMPHGALFGVVSLGRVTGCSFGSF